jgi:antibiotic biosynthesis monooxygenase (ABM) superfamily enzyme
MPNVLSEWLALPLRVRNSAYRPVYQQSAVTWSGLTCCSCCATVIVGPFVRTNAAFNCILTSNLQARLKTDQQRKHTPAFYTEFTDVF